MILLARYTYSMMTSNDLKALDDLRWPQSQQTYI